MSEISKIVKFTVIADQISSKVKVMDLAKDDVIVVQLPSGSTQDEVEMFHDTVSKIIGLKNEVLVMVDPIDVFGATLQEIAEMKKHLGNLEEELFKGLGVPQQLLEGEKK